MNYMIHTKRITSSSLVKFAAIQTVVLTAGLFLAMPAHADGWQLSTKQDLSWKERHECPSSISCMKRYLRLKKTDPNLKIKVVVRRSGSGYFEITRKAACTDACLTNPDAFIEAQRLSLK